MPPLPFLEQCWQPSDFEDSEYPSCQLRRQYRTTNKATQLETRGFRPFKPSTIFKGSGRRVAAGSSEDERCLPVTLSAWCVISFALTLGACFLPLSRCFTSTETIWLIRDGGRMGTQAHLPVHTDLELCLGGIFFFFFMLLYVNRNRMAY